MIDEAVQVWDVATSCLTMHHAEISALSVGQRSAALKLPDQWNDGDISLFGTNKHRNSIGVETLKL
jgi:hypothetical protein